MQIQKTQCSQSVCMHVWHYTQAHAQCSHAYTTLHVDRAAYPKQIRNNYTERCHARVKEYYTYCYYVKPNQRRRRKEQVAGIGNRWCLNNASWEVFTNSAKKKKRNRYALEIEYALNQLANNPWQGSCVLLAFSERSVKARTMPNHAFLEACILTSSVRDGITCRVFFTGNRLVKRL